MISISTKQGMQGHLHTHFDLVKPPDIASFSRVIATKVWSPIVWSGGVRKGENFISCQYMALDFDDGLFTLDDAKQWLADKNLSGIIGTSKSHQKEKTTPSGKILPAVDRFRLVTPLAEPIRKASQYIYNMTAIMDELPCDKACKDAARYFFPCRDIVHTQYIADGKYPVRPDDPKREERAQAAAEKVQTTGILPAAVSNALAHGVQPGNRHVTFFKIGAFMTYAGYQPNEIMYAVQESPLGKDSPYSATEMERSIMNGVRAATKRMSDG
jgi:hypothetical protein